MSIYVFRGNNNAVRDGKLHFFVCNECGSVNLKDPRESESDHRDVLRFTCNSCGYTPYWGWMHVDDAIQITNENAETIKHEICGQNGWNPDEYEFRVKL